MALSGTALTVLGNDAVRLVCISDTHSRHQNIPNIPIGDVLIHAGDCTGNGSLPALQDFADWFGSLPHKRKILIAGNHDFCFERYPTWSREMCEKAGINYLEDEQLVLDDLVFFGSPWTPQFRDMAFNAVEKDMFKHRALIPQSTEILITHGPALHIFDFIPSVGEHVGCYPLAKRIGELGRLKAHICGHIHEGYGFATRELDGVKFANASTCNEAYQPVNPPIVVDI